MGLKNLFTRKKKKKSSKVKSSTADGNGGGVPSTTTNSAVSTPAVSRANSSLPSRARIEEELEQVFNKFDVNGDGRICWSELGSIMGSLGHRATEEELRNMIREVDSDGDGFIDLREFIELNTKDIDSAEVMENLKEAFSVFDIDKNGCITAEELQNVLGSLGEECTIGECRKMIAGVDRDGDGMISFEEFKVMMMVGSHLDAVGSG